MLPDGRSAGFTSVGSKGYRNASLNRKWWGRVTRVRSFRVLAHWVDELRTPEVMWPVVEEVASTGVSDRRLSDVGGFFQYSTTEVQESPPSAADCGQVVRESPTSPPIVSTTAFFGCLRPIGIRQGI